MTNKGILTYFSIIFMLFLPKGVEHIIFPNNPHDFLWAQWIFVFFSIPLIDYTLKAYYKNFKDWNMEVSALGSFLNKALLGIPFLLYGNISLVMMIVNKRNIVLKEEKWGVYILGILSIGIIPLTVLLITGPLMLVVAYVLKDWYLLKDNQMLFFITTFASAILTKGIILLAIYAGIVLLRLSLTVMKWGDETSIKIYEIFLILATLIYVLTLYEGFIVLVRILITTFSFYYFFDIIFIDINNSKTSPDKANELLEYLSTRKQK